MNTATKHWFRSTDSDGNDVTSELLGFAEFIGLERVASGRYSVLLLLALYAGMRSGQQNPPKVIHEIEALEGLRVNSRSKPASIFKRDKPLKGLWHKHYLEDGLPSMATNLRKGIARYGLPWVKNVMAEAQATGEERIVAKQDIAQIAHDAVISNWERLVADSALTGEWIVFAQHEGKNYYLCLGRHKGGDELLRSQIDTVCVREFPFLKKILSNKPSENEHHEPDLP